MFIVSSEVPAYGEFVLVTIERPISPHALRVPATVRWVTDTGFGVQFGALGVRETGALVAFLRSSKTGS